MSRLIRLPLVVLLFAAPLLAQAAPPRFLIERIDVRHLRHASPEIVIAESRIRAGATYSEEELREAADRIARLPFVLQCDFALEKGSVREAYVLAINVAEAKPDLWDDVYLAERIDFENRRDAQRLRADQLEKWWRSATRLMASSDRLLVDVELLVLPFSAREERDTRQWLSRSGGAGAAGSTISGGLVDALIGTTITARPIVSFRWSSR